MFLLILANIC